jgi:phosphoribosylaminoimidazole-succinocarboxamide synthase
MRSQAIARHMLIVTTDRLSAFDVVLPDPDSGQGARAYQYFQLLVRAHRPHRTQPPGGPAYSSLERVVPDADDRALLADRAIVVRKLKALPVEAVVRGYLIGSGWKDYQRDRRGLRHPRCRAGLRMADTAAGTDLHAGSTKAPSASTTRTSASTRSRA